MVSGAEPSMSREMNNSVRTECGRKEKTEESVRRASKAKSKQGSHSQRILIGKTKLA